MRPGLVVGLAAIGSLVGTLPASAGKAPTYDELPASTTQAPPAAASKPKGIGARESIPGLKTRAVRSATALAFETTTGKPAVKVSELGGCIGVDPGASSDGDGPLDAESRHPAQRGVLAVRAEKLVDGTDGSSRLELTDAWFDTRTRGVRAVGRSTLALRLLSTLPGGTRILAGRDEHGGKAYVQFVVAEPKDTPAYLLAETRGAMTRIGSQARSQLLGRCSHHRIAIATEGPGESVGFDLKLLLPPLGPGERSVAVDLLPPMTSWDHEKARVDVRRRTVHVQLGASRTSRDRVPVLSVSAEWSSDETVERIFTGAEATLDAHMVFEPDGEAALEDLHGVF